MIKLYNEDYRKVKLNNKADFILVDIPYNIGKNAYASNVRWWEDGNYKNGKSNLANTNFFETDENFNIEDMMFYINENLKEDSKALIFCSYEQQFEIINIMKKYKDFIKYTPLVFIKNHSSEVLKSNMRIVGACEYGLILYKNKLGYFNNKGKMIKNWFNIRRLNKKKHPNEKSLETLEFFINLFTKEDDLVLDFCMGSGSTGIACINTKRNFIGIEIDEKYFNIAKERINNLESKGE